MPYRLWKSLHLFEHGVMDQPSRAFSGFFQHATTAGLCSDNEPSSSTSAPLLQKCILEIGPGDSLFTAIIAAALGAKRTWLIDSGPFATTDMAAYRAMDAYLPERGLSPILKPSVDTPEGVLAACNANYLTCGVNSLTEIPPNSVDYHFSNAVLEHIPHEEFESFCRALRQLTANNGLGVHRVDLQDHLGGSLNNLRFSRRTWEGRLFSKSGFYTNRIRFGEMIGMLEKSGFQCEVTRIIRWDSLPISRNVLDEEFRGLPDDDLLVQGFDVLLRPK